MFQNKTSRPATTAELAALKAEAQKPAYAGFTAAQIADALNSPRSVPNPAPQGRVPRASVAKADVQKVLLAVVMGLMRAQDARLPAYQYIQAQVNAYAGDSYAIADLAPYVTEFEQDGTLTPAQIGALTTDPDPAYQATVAAGPLAFQALGSDSLPEPADVAAALAG